MRQVELSIVIVNWNSREHLRTCLASVLSKTSEIAFEIVVIDSGSRDGCGDMVREDYPAVRFIQAETNLGFARANNVACRESRGRWLLFLNPDTELVGRAVERLLAAAQRLSAAGVVGCKLLNGDGTLQATCVQSFPTILNQLLGADAVIARWPQSRLWGQAVVHRAESGALEVEAISGACLLIRRDVFDRVGGFAEDYFMYAEDIDLSYQVQGAGYTNYYVSDAVVIHHGGASSSQAASLFAAVMMREAVWRFLRKTRGPAYGFGYRLAMLSSAVGRIAILAVASVAVHGAPLSAKRRKWTAILRWALGRDRTVRQYYAR